MTESDVARLLMFAAEGNRYGCKLEAVREILPFRAVTRLPGAPPYVVGLINLRGRLVTVVDLAVQLGNRDAGSVLPPGASIVLLESGTRLVGVMVDEVRDVRPVSAGAVEPIQNDGAAPGVFRALARFADGTAVVLDTDALIAQVLQ